jgi:hypothetical protein
VSFAFEVLRWPSKSRPPIAHSASSSWLLRTESLLEPFGALPSEVVEANSLKDMVGPCGPEPQTSTLSIDQKPPCSREMRRHRLYRPLGEKCARRRCQSLITQTLTDDISHAQIRLQTSSFCRRITFWRTTVTPQLLWTARQLRVPWESCSTDIAPRRCRRRIRNSRTANP